MTKSQKKILSYIIKATVVVLASIFIYKKLSNDQNLKNFLKIINDLATGKVWLIMTIVFLLMFVNWFIESLKWQYIMLKIEKISFIKAVESVFCGLTWGIFTPNRLGEYGGRIFFLSPRKRIQGIVAMVVGNISQMVLVYVFGSLALLWFIFNFIPLSPIILFSLVVLTFFFVLFFTIFYFNIHWLERLLDSIKYLKRFKKFFSVINRYHKKELSRIILYSFSRFLVFTSQYLFVFYLLIPEIAFYEAALMIFIMFFVQAALPSLDLLDVGVRSLTATYLFSFITHQEIAVMATVALIWFVNLIIPAILGSIFVFKLNFFGSSSH